MIIQSVKLRNFKKHQALDLVFDEKLNLIGGPNEAGKSTIAEAIHAALFFKHSGNSKEQRELQSITSADSPSVELHFQLNGKLYTLKKTFLRGSGCTLSAAGQPTFAGSAAEEELGRLLSSSGPQSSPSQAKAEWAHLWVWQGSAGTNPTSNMASQQSKIFSQLESLGVMAAIASDKDQQVAEAFANRFDDIFTQQGRVKASANLTKVEQKFEEIDSSFKSLTNSIQQLEEKSKEHASKKIQLADLKLRFEELKKEEENCKKDLQRLTDLEGKLLKEKELLESYLSKEKDLRGKLADINLLKEEIKSLEEELQPLQTMIAELDKKISNHTHEATKEDEMIDQLIREEAVLKNELGYCELLLKMGSKKDALRALKKKIEEIKSINKKIDALRKELGELPLIEQKHLDEWVRLENQVQNFKGLLDAIATEIEILTDDSKISMGGELVSGKVRLTEESIVQVNGSDILKISPGGGKNLADATQDFQIADEQFLNFKKSLGIQEKSKAQEIVIKREFLNGQLSNENAKLIVSGNLSDLQIDQTQVEAELSQLDLQIENMLDLDPHLKGLQFAEIESDKNELETKKAAVSVRIQEKRNLLASITHTLKVLNEEKKKKIDDSIATADKLTGAKSKLDLLQEQVGSELVDFKSIEADRIAQEEICFHLNIELDAMMPEQLKTKHQRIQDGLQNQDAQLRKLEIDLATLVGELKQQGDQNLYLDQQAAFTKKEMLYSQLKGLRREADAVVLLKQLFADEQQELTKSYSTPFAEKVQHYLSFIFGRNVQVIIQSSPSGDFSGLEIYRDQFQDVGTIDFDKLSGGTKEQMAAAVRLAMAEVLAPAYGGHLPMVFDDAFAYSDKDRLKVLPDMLFAASQRGIQIIILSCSPQDYAGLGGHQTDLSA